ncbi:hypothetical protein I553_9000 [Mycobacterium xenopi 4042]|uniref:Uncharacterized protein n=1 Tax=Mycobacterium xenopi 4042 TaxID=1299334 RepID=X8AM11_MYCXE|nr:hypothetical protein I553_9000 [Mycobacterium xenopi 4042]
MIDGVQLEVQVVDAVGVRLLGCDCLVYLDLAHDPGLRVVAAVDPLLFGFGCGASESRAVEHRVGPIRLCR